MIDEFDFLLLENGCVGKWIRTTTTRKQKKIDLESYGGYATICPAFATVCDGSMQCRYTRLRIIMGYITPLSGGSTAHSLTAVASTRVPRCADGRGFPPAVRYEYCASTR